MLSQSGADPHEPLPKYRADVEGLRAIAVLAVVLFHLGVRQLSGGYAGVDVFFVISGFVISRMIQDELDAGRFSFRRFYRRRIFRILPALLATIMVTSVAAFTTFSPDRFLIYARSAVGAVLSFSNVVFWFESGYFDVASELKPLLHTWSLGIEEQFYLLWPGLLYVLARNVRTTDRRRALGALLAISLASLLAAEWLRPTAATMVFYWMPFRVFEFGAGAVVVYLPRLASLKLRTAALTLGLAAMIASFFVFDRLTPFPGLRALLPCVGAALAIAGGESPLGSRILGNRLAAYFGRHSYALYLVHWPIAVFVRQRLSEVAWYLIGPASFAVMLGLAHLMHVAIEVPFREWGRAEGSHRLRSGAVAIAGTVVVVLTASVAAARGMLSPVHPFDDRIALPPARIEAEKQKRYTVYNSSCERDGTDLCVRTLPGRYNVLIVGDSHAIDAYNALHWRFPAFNFVFSALPGCPPTRDIRAIVLPTHPDLVACEALNKRRFDPQTLAGYDLVVVSLMTQWFSAEQLEPYVEFVRSKSGAKLIVLGNYIILKSDVTDIIQAPGFRGNASFESEIESRFLGEETFTELAARHDFLFLSKKQAFCRPDCIFVDDNGIPFTWDRHHLSLEFAQRLGDSIAPTVEEYVGRN